MPRVSRWKGDDREPANRLVYLLDHESTQRGLSWDRLKGADAERAALLQAAAEDAACEAVLALTEIKETWDTEPGRRGRGVDLTYIITSELILNWWTGVPGGEPISLYVPDEQVCASTPSADLKPYDSEYTGYMGNCGNTMDRWYRRAAIVVWPRQSMCLNADNRGGGVHQESRVQLWNCYLPRRDDFTRFNESWDFGTWLRAMQSGTTSYPLFLGAGNYSLGADDKSLQGGLPAAPVSIINHYGFLGILVLAMSASVAAGLASPAGARSRHFRYLAAGRPDAQAGRVFFPGSLL